MPETPLPASNTHEGDEIFLTARAGGELRRIFSHYGLGENNEPGYSPEMIDLYSKQFMKEGSVSFWGRRHWGPDQLVKITVNKADTRTRVPIASASGVVPQFTIYGDEIEGLNRISALFDNKSLLEIITILSRCHCEIEG